MGSAIDTGLPDRLFAAVHAERAVADLQKYFKAGPPGTGYTGRFFEQFDGGGDRLEVANRFTAADIVAVSALSMRISPHVSWRLLQHDALDISELLAQIPNQQDMWDVEDADIGDGSAAATLWTKLRGMAYDGGTDGRAWVTAGKLLARKRPRLLPVYDRRVKQAALLAPNANWWLSLRAALQKDLRKAIQDAGQRAAVPQDVSTLRTLDVILWMGGQ